jgi:hypothetical protein
MVWFCIRGQGGTGDLGAQFMEPQGKPGTFEAGVTGNEDGFTLVEAIKHLQCFFGLFCHFDKLRGYYFSEDRIRTPIGVITVKACANS